MAHRKTDNLQQLNSPFTEDGKKKAALVDVQQTSSSMIGTQHQQQQNLVQSSNQGGTKQQVVVQQQVSQQIQPQTAVASSSQVHFKNNLSANELLIFSRLKQMDSDTRKLFVSSNPEVKELLKQKMQIIKQAQQAGPTIASNVSGGSHIFPAEPAFLNYANLKNKIARIVKSNGLKTSVSEKMLEFFSLAVQDRMRSVVEELVLNSKSRMTNTPIDASENASFVEITTSISNAQLVQRELQIKQKVLQEDEQRREEEEKTKEAQRKKQSSSSGDNKRKRIQSSKEEEEQMVADMNEAISVAFALGRKSSPSNLSQGKIATSTSSSLKKTSSSNNVTAGGSNGSNKQYGQGNGSDDESTGKQSTTTIIITPRDVLLYFEQEPRLRKSKLLDLYTSFVNI